MSLQVHQNLEHAATVTYTGAGGAVVLWGLHLSDIAVCISAAAALGGFLLQVWVARAKVQLMKRSERWKAGDK
jgi:hypothetical protein